jgi:hypothetical protein
MPNPTITDIRNKNVFSKIVPQTPQPLNDKIPYLLE